MRTRNIQYLNPPSQKKRSVPLEFVLVRAKSFAFALVNTISMGYKIQHEMEEALKTSYFKHEQSSNISFWD